MPWISFVLLCFWVHGSGDTEPQRYKTLLMTGRVSIFSVLRISDVMDSLWISSTTSIHLREFKSFFDFISKS